MHDCRSRRTDVDVVSSYQARQLSVNQCLYYPEPPRLGTLTFVSTCEILPTTFMWLSRTGREVTLLRCMSSSASISGLSPLRMC